MMKRAINFSFFTILLAGMACVSPASVAEQFDCEDIYFAPDDVNHERALQKPHPEFLKSYRKAMDGDAMEQRNVAVSYDAGYLLKACPEKAYYWYRKAAQSGDQVAQDWLARHDEFEAVHNGPEFINLILSPPLAAKKNGPNSAASPSGDGSNTDNRITYKCANVLDGSDIYSSKPCPKMMGRSLVSDK